MKNSANKTVKQGIKKDVILLCVIVLFAILSMFVISMLNTNGTEALADSKDVNITEYNLSDGIYISDSKSGIITKVSEAVRNEETIIESNSETNGENISNDNCEDEEIVYKTVEILIGEDLNQSEILTADELLKNTDKYLPTVTTVSGGYYSSWKSGGSQYVSNSASDSASGWPRASCSCSCSINVLFRIPGSGLLYNVLANGGQVTIDTWWSGQSGWGSWWHSGGGQQTFYSTGYTRNLTGGSSASASATKIFGKASCSCSCGVSGTANCNYYVNVDPNHYAAIFDGWGNNGSTWKTSGTAHYRVQDNRCGVYGANATIVNTSGGTSTSVLLTHNASRALSSLNEANTGTSYSYTSCTYWEFTRGRSYSITVSAANMKIDRAAPTISSAYVCTNSSGTNMNVDTYHMSSSVGTLYFKFSASDGGGIAATSGINKVRIYNNSQSGIDSTQTFSASNSITNKVIAVTIPSDKKACVNGVYCVVVYDQAGQASSTYTISSQPIKLYDITIPTVNTSVTYNAQSGNQALTTGSKTIVNCANGSNQDGLTYGKNSYTNAPLKITVSISDTTGQNLSQVAYNAPSIASVSISFYYCNVNKTFTISDSGTTTYKANDSHNYASTSGGYNSAKTLTRTYTFYLPYSPASIFKASGKYTDNDCGYTITAKDAAGNTKSQEINTNSYAGTKSNYLIDTAAPQITGVTLTNNGTSSTYSNKDVTITIKAKDYAHNSSTGSYYSKNGSFRYNDGSGVKYIYIGKQAIGTALTVGEFKKYFTAQSNLYNSGDGDSTAVKLKVATLNDGKFGQEITFNITQKCDSNIINQLYFYAEDFVGNVGKATLSSEGVNAHGVTCNHSGVNKDGSVSGYYLHQTEATLSDKNALVYRDTYIPQIQLFNSSGKVIASTNSYKNGYNGDKNTPTTQYTFQWTTSETNVKVRYYYGCSGGTYTVNANNQAGNTTVNPTMTLGGTAITLSNNLSTGIQGSKSTTSATSYSSYYNSADLSFKYNTNGETKKTFDITTNNGQYAKIEITFRYDTKAPVVELTELVCKDGNSTKYTIPRSDFKNKIKATDKYLYADNAYSYYLHFTITDDGAGITNNGANTRSFGINGNTESNSKNSSQPAYNYVETYNGATTTNTSAVCEASNTQSGNIYVKLFNSISNVSPVTGVTFDHAFKFYDWLGNVVTPTPSSLDSNQTTSKFKYNIDPFNSDIKSTNDIPEIMVYTFTDDSMYTAIQQGKDITTYDSNKYTEYTLSDWAINSANWKKGYFIVREEHTQTIAGVKGYLLYNNLSATYGINSLYCRDSKLGNFDSKTKPTGGVASSVRVSDTVYEYLFDRSSRVIQFAVYLGAKDNSLIDQNGSYYTQSRISELRYGYVFNTPKYKSNETETIKLNYKDESYFVIKQDNNAPKVEAVYYTTEGHSESNALIYFDASVNNDKYSYTFNSNKSKNKNFIMDSTNYNSKYQEAAYNIFWSTQKLVLCIKVTDSITTVNGTENGAGASVLELTQGSTKYSTRRIADLANNAFYFEFDNNGTKVANTIIDTNFSYKIRVEDAAGNETNVDKEINISNDKYTMYPTLDNVVPNVTITDITSGGSACYETKDVDSLYYKTIKKGFMANGKISVNLQLAFGLSGVKLYLKKYGNEVHEVFGKDDDTGKDYFAIKTIYNDNKPLHYYKSGNNFEASLTGFEFGSWNSNYTVFNVGTAYPGSEIYQTSSNTLTVEFNMTSSKEYYDILAVGNNGMYYLIHIGRVYIDTEPPKFINDLTFFSAVSSVDDDASDVEYSYTNIQKLWTNKVDNTIFTNAPVNVYTHLEDLASGVFNVTYGDTILTKVTISNVPILEHRTTKAKELYYGQSYDNNVKEKKNETLEYYRLKVETSNDINLTAKDNAGNITPHNSYPSYKFTSVKPNIDNTGVTIANTNKDDNTWTNANKEIKFTITTGLSQMAKFVLLETPIKGDAIIRTFVMPKYTSDGKITPTSGDQTYISTYLNIQVKKLNNTYTYSFTLTYTNDIDSRFDITAYNGISESYAKGYKDDTKYKECSLEADCNAESVIPHEHSYYKVRIDTTKPVIDINTNSNLSLITNWHQIARAVKVGFKDANNGNDVVSGIDNENLSLYVKNGNSYTSVSVFNLLSSNNDSKDPYAGIYTSYSAGNPYELNAYKEYKITIKDKAGNETEYEFTNKYDDSGVTISNAKLYFETPQGTKVINASNIYNKEDYVYYMKQDVINKFVAKSLITSCFI